MDDFYGETNSAGEVDFHSKDTNVLGTSVLDINRGNRDGHSELQGEAGEGERLEQFSIWPGGLYTICCGPRKII